MLFTGSVWRGALDAHFHTPELYIKVIRQVAFSWTSTWQLADRRSSSVHRRVHEVE